MKHLLSAITLCLLSQESFSQERWLLGTGVTYCSYIEQPGINLNVTYRLIGDLHVGPDFSALLTDDYRENGQRVKKKELEYNFNAQQLFELGERWALYPLVGLNWSKLTVHPDGQDAVVRRLTALNVGGGTEWKLRRLRLFFETKWVSRPSKYDFTAGLIVPL